MENMGKDATDCFTFFCCVCDAPRYGGKITDVQMMAANFKEFSLTYSNKIQAQYMRQFFQSIGKMAYPN